MKKLVLLAAIAFSAFVSSCGGKKDTNQMKEVLAIHDEVMLKMSNLGSLVGELNSKENDSTELGLQYRQARKDLQASHKSMMDWMQNFGNRFNSDEILDGKELSRQKKQWLDEEEEKVKALRDQINSSIANAEKLLKKEK